jgi:hypothetical protein
MKHLNELKTRLHLSLDEMDFGEATLLVLTDIEDEGGAEKCAKLKAAFKVNLLKNMLESFF